VQRTHRRDRHEHMRRALANFESQVVLSYFGLVAFCTFEVWHVSRVPEIDPAVPITASALALFLAAVGFLCVIELYWWSVELENPHTFSPVIPAAAPAVAAPTASQPLSRARAPPDGARVRPQRRTGSSPHGSSSTVSPRQVLDVTSWVDDSRIPAEAPPESQQKDSTPEPVESRPWNERFVERTCDDAPVFGSLFMRDAFVGERTRTPTAVAESQHSRDCGRGDLPGCAYVEEHEGSV